MLVVTREVEEGLLIGSDVRVRVLGIEVLANGRRRVQLGIEAPRAVPVWREEIAPAVSSPFVTNTRTPEGSAVGKSQPVFVKTLIAQVAEATMMRPPSNGSGSTLQEACLACVPQSAPASLRCSPPSRSLQLALSPSRRRPR